MKLRKKLRAAKGETLVEVLVAMLVITLTSVLFATMVSAASKMNQEAARRDEALYAAVTAAETGGEALGTGTVTVTIYGEDLSFQAAYSGVDGELAAYRADGGGGA